MRKIIIACCVTLTLVCISLPQTAKADPITEVIKAAVKKVIQAMDLAIQRIQNETVRLQNVQKAIENAMNKLKLREIYEWGVKQKELFGSYYDELWKVKNAIAYYKRAREIIQMQVQVVNEYKRAVDAITKIKGFNPREIEYMLDVYAGILDQSVRNVEQIVIIINSFSTQMSDAKRLELIHLAAGGIEKNLTDLRSFTNQNVLLGLQRIKDHTELQTLKGLYNLP